MKAPESFADLSRDVIDDIMDVTFMNTEPRELPLYAIAGPWHDSFFAKLDVSNDVVWHETGIVEGTLSFVRVRQANYTYKHSGPGGYISTLIIHCFVPIGNIKGLKQCIQDTRRDVELVVGSFLSYDYKFDWSILRDVLRLTVRRVNDEDYEDMDTSSEESSSSEEEEEEEEEQKWEEEEEEEDEESLVKFLDAQMAGDKLVSLKINCPIEVNEQRCLDLVLKPNFERLELDQQLSFDVCRQIYEHFKATDSVCRHTKVVSFNYEEDPRHSTNEVRGRLRRLIGTDHDYAVVNTNHPDMIVYVKIGTKRITISLMYKQ
ncbi:hypothetical protein QR680_007664 [Steinernema hermaphroditum]|uniref:Uncharacterized protein n=1 Tax=Steinernema hermaphroditum TaxID=289476 RepID=A0AA39IDW8_9BILA|nr:hypothetical protein QR680_007664 [Steinernema hermaphroditum]